MLLIESLVNSGLNYEDPKVAKSVGQLRVMGKH